MTAEQIASLNLGITLDDKAVLNISAALEWLDAHTTIDTNETLPARAKLFLVKYNDLMSLSTGVSSESIEGLSQSFSSGNASSLIWDIAYDLLESDVISPVKFIAATNRWK